MRVNKLFIICLTLSVERRMEEIKAGGLALYRRYTSADLRGRAAVKRAAMYPVKRYPQNEGQRDLMNAASVQLIFVDLARFNRNPGGSLADLEGAGVFEYPYGNGELDRGDGNPNTGVYVMAHGDKDKGILDCPPKLLATLLTTLGFKAIRKLCLLSCFVGAEKGNQGYLSDLCLAMSGGFEGTLVAGWNDWISVCYPGIDQDNPPDFEAPGIAVDYPIPLEKVIKSRAVASKKDDYLDLDANTGRRLVRGSKGALKGKTTVIAKAEREKQKVFWVVRHGAPQRMELKNWTDKPEWK